MHVFCVLKSYQKLTRQGLLCRGLCTSGRQLPSVSVKKRSDGVSAGELKFIATYITKVNLGHTPAKGLNRQVFLCRQITIPPANQESLPRDSESRSPERDLIFASESAVYDGVLSF